MENIKALLRGIASHVPRSSRLATGGTISARYCYSVWLRHLTMAYRNSLPTRPNVVAELGPGDSLGTGLAALISGANKYYAFDILKYANNKRNLEIFDELVSLFKKRESIPDRLEFPQVKPFLESYEFPIHILTDEHLNASLKQGRIESIRNALLNPDAANTGGIQISYFAPWYDSKVIEEASIDMIYSQAVLEHIDNLDYSYEILHRWLKPGGFMSHQIDFKCHETAKEWNGHWSYSDFMWKLIRGRRPYLLNRQPHSTHITLLRKFNFEVICDIKTTDTSGIPRERLAPRFQNMCEDDLTTSGAFIQATKEAR